MTLFESVERARHSVWRLPDRVGRDAVRRLASTAVRLKRMPHSCRQCTMCSIPIQRGWSRSCHEWGAPAHEKLEGGRTMRSCALEGKCMLWLRYAGARRRQLETQAGREVPVVGDADAKELQSGGSGLSEGGHRAQVRLPGLAAHLRGDVARARWCVPVQRIHRASRHAPPVDGVSIVSL